MTAKSQGEETKTTKTPFAECMEQMMATCGPDMKQWMEACTSNTSEACSSCCGTKPTAGTPEKK
jgi:hypothetical protein